MRKPSWVSRDGLWGLILILAVFLAYQPVWYAGFIWDDDGRITANPCIVGPLGLKEIWTTSAADLCPLVYTTFWVEHALWGLAPLPYHLANVLLHGVCAVLLWRVLQSLEVPGAWLGAALWGLHPVQVETAAWVTEMKNTQSGMFYLLTILFYVKGVKARAGGDRSGDGWNYGLTLLFAALAMASKSSTVVLPVVLGLCAWWVEGRWHWRNLARLTPLAVFALFPSLLTLWTQKLVEQAPGDIQYARSLPERLATAGDAVWFYLGKLAWPHPLIFIYPRWKIDAGSWISYLPLLAVIVVLSVLWRKRETWSRPYFFTFAYFAGALLPVLGLIDGYFWRFSLVGDHLQYLASMGPLALAGAGLVKLAEVVIPRKPWLQSSLGFGLLLILGSLSWVRAWTYQDIETLWADTVSRNPSSWMAHNNLGDALSHQGQLDEAIVQFQEALAIKPNYTEAHNNLGNALLQKGQVDEAMAEFQKALAMNPHDEEAHNNLGNALLQQGRVAPAMAEYQEVLRINPNLAEGHNNLGNALLQAGRIDDAIRQYQAALALRANYAEAHNDLGSALSHQGQLDAAVLQYEKALEIKPGYAECHDNLGSAFLREGRLNEAIVQFQNALEINPQDAEAHGHLGYGLWQEGRVDEAMAEYQKALETKPNDVEARNYLGTALLQKGRVDEAIAQYQRALELKPDDAEAHNNLGSALAQKGRLSDAMVQFQKALQINPNYSEAQKNLATARAIARPTP